MAQITKRIVRAELEDPPPAGFLFNNPASAILWLLLRLYLGYQWFTAGEHKVTDPKWMATGEALRAYWERAIAIPAAPARPAITFDWYRSFLQYLLDVGAYTWFAKVVAVGEVVLGVLLIVGLLTGIAAFFGAFMNWNFMMAGTASTNPLLFTIAIGLMLAWKVAGYYGLDRVVLPALGTPWQLGRLVRPRTPAAARRAAGIA